MLPEIKNLKKTAKRILKAVKSKEKIVIYGDSDLDGVTSVIILKECIRNLGGETTAVYFADRERDGYGITEKGLFYLKKYSPALFLALDCGIGNFEEIKIAKKLGFEVIVIDHHEILDKLPSASIIVDPKQKGDKYPFKYFAAVGIVFRLTKILLGEKMTEALKNNFLELVALATIADMMPRVEDNEQMIIEGLGSLKSSWRPGIQALFELEPEINKVNSILNIRDVEKGLPAAFRLLTSTDRKEAEKLAKKLLEKGAEKREKIREIIEEVEEKITGKEKEPIIFEGKENWELIYLGIVDSILSQKTQKPVFLYKKGKEESQGSIRAPSGFNTVQAMKKCSENLITYGGHPQASGFKINNKHLEQFKECLSNYFK